MLNLPEHVEPGLSAAPPCHLPSQRAAESAIRMPPEDVLRLLNHADVEYGPEFVAALRQFTEDNRYTQRQLAAAWRCSQGKVSVWFCGKLGRKAHEKMARLAHDWYWNTDHTRQAGDVHPAANPRTKLRPGFTGGLETIIGSQSSWSGGGGVQQPTPSPDASQRLFSCLSVDNTQSSRGATFRLGGGLSGSAMFSQLSEGAESPFTSLDVYQRPGEKRVQRYHDRQTPPKRCLSSCDGEAFLCSPASPRTSGVSSGEALAHSADVETVWQDVFNLDAGTAGQEYYQGLLGEGQADDMEAVSIKSGEGPLPNAPWGPMPPLVPLITWSGDSTGDGIDLDLDDVLSIANSQELGVSQHCHSTDEWSVPAPFDACHLQFWHGDDSCVSGSTVSLSQVVQTGVQGADTDEADECWWPLDRREAPGVMDYAAEGVRTFAVPSLTTKDGPSIRLDAHYALSDAWIRHMEESTTNVGLRTVIPSHF